MYICIDHSIVIDKSVSGAVILLCSRLYVKMVLHDVMMEGFLITPRKWSTGKKILIVAPGMESLVIQWRVMWSALILVVAGFPVVSPPIVASLVFLTCKGSTSLSMSFIPPMFILVLRNSPIWHTLTFLPQILLVNSHLKSLTCPDWFLLIFLIILSSLKHLFWKG